MTNPILSLLSSGFKAARAFAELTGKEIVELPRKTNQTPTVFQRLPVRIMGRNALLPASRVPNPA